MYIILNNMKTILTLVFAFVFVVGCQGQYPEHEVTDTSLCTTPLPVMDSAIVVIYYHSLDDGQRANIVRSEVVASHNKFESIREMKIYTFGNQSGEMIHRYTRGILKQIKEARYHDFPCGFYKLEVIKEGDTLFWMHFTKCNPSYLKN